MLSTSAGAEHRRAGGAWVDRDSGEADDAGVARASMERAHLALLSYPPRKQLLAPDLGGTLEKRANQCDLHYGRELMHTARPVSGHEFSERRAREFHCRELMARRSSRAEMARKIGNILLAQLGRASRGSDQRAE